MRKLQFTLIPVLTLCLALLLGVATAPAESEAAPPVEPVQITHTPVEPFPETEPAPLPKQWTDEEAAALAKMLWGEVRGVPSDMEKAACVWCVLNRCDAYGQTILEVVTAPYQFVGYRTENPVDEALLALCEDVLTRYFAEKRGEVDVGRVLPKDYLWFTGDGQRNHFRNAYIGGTTYDWSLKNPYEH
jgi:hypothetical protein